MQNAYLPTMPEDSLYEVRQVAGGQFYGGYLFINNNLSDVN